MPLQGFPIQFEIYAHNEQEVEVLRFVITEFIRIHAEQGRAVSATKVTEALRDWDKNPIIKNRIISYLNGQ